MQINEHTSVKPVIQVEKEANGGVAVGFGGDVGGDTTRGAGGDVGRRDAVGSEVVGDEGGAAIAKIKATSLVYNRQTA